VPRLAPQTLRPIEKTGSKWDMDTA
jgi:hypothetical protein